MSKITGRVNYKQVLKGDTGFTYEPHVTTDGILYWSNNGGLPNPLPVNIKGRDGDIAQQEELDIINKKIEVMENKINNITYHIDIFKHLVTIENGFENWTEAIKQAFSSGVNIIFDFNKEYKITEPIQFKPKQVYNTYKPVIDLNNSKIIKVTETNGIGYENFKNDETVTYNKDAIIIIEISTDGGYSGGFILKNGSLQGNINGDKKYNDFGIYAPHITHIELENIKIYNCMTAIYHESAWLYNIKNLTAVECRGAIHINKTGTSLNVTNAWARDGNKLIPKGEYVANEVYCFTGLEYPTLNTLIAERQDNITLFKINNCHGGIYNLSSEDTYNVKLIECNENSNVNINSLDCLKVINTVDRNNIEITDKKEFISIGDSSILKVELIDLRWCKRDVLIRARHKSKCLIDTSSINDFDYNTDIIHYSIYTNVICTNLNTNINNIKALGSTINNDTMKNIVNCNINDGVVENIEEGESSFMFEIENKALPLKLIIRLKGKCQINIGTRNYSINNEKTENICLFIFSKNEKEITIIKENNSQLKIDWIMVTKNMNANINQISYELSQTYSNGIELKLIGTWVAYDGEYSIKKPYISMNDYGNVKLGGAIKDGVTGTNIAKIPVTYLPNTDIICISSSPLASFQENAQIGILKSGYIKCLNGVNSFISLDNINYNKEV